MISITNGAMIRLALFALPVLLLGRAASRWISSCYRRDPSILSHPAQMDQHGVLRRFPGCTFLAAGALTIIRHPELPTSSLILLLLFVFFLLLFTMTDWEQQVIFDRMLLPFALLGLLHTLLAGLPVTDHLLAALAGGGLFLLLAVLTRGGIGGGDIKLIAALGLWSGTEGLTAIAVSGLILGGLAALVLLLTGRKKRSDYFPYGPGFTITALFLAWM